MITKKSAAIYVIHENETWVRPLFQHLKTMKVPFHNWFINHGKLNINDIPPVGVFYNRMSASAHTRDHRYAVELTESILAWLELYDRRIINSRKALTLEVRKVEQQLALSRFGISTPKTIVVNNINDLIAAADELNTFPFIIKPNRGGKGTDVTLFNTLNQLKSCIQDDTLPKSLDGILLVQEYIQSMDERITRVEFIGGKYYYAVSVDASGGFELCPADGCQVTDKFCPVDSTENQEGAKPKFKIVSDYTNPDIYKYEQFLKASGIEIGALEYVTDKNGQRVVYDVNTNTNYNAGAELELEDKFQGMRRIAEFLTRELREAISSKSNVLRVVTSA